MSITSTGTSKLGRRRAFRVNDVANLCGLSRSQIYNLMRAKQLDYVEVGRIRLITDAALRRLLKEEDAD
jgi:excisionase family DNA binding protein